MELANMGKQEEEQEKGRERNWESKAGRQEEGREKKSRLGGNEVECSLGCASESHSRDIQFIHLTRIC